MRISVTGTKVLLCMFVAAALSNSTATVQGEVVALWRFEPGALTEDSSGNGHTLASLEVAEGLASPAPGSTGSALFNGSGIMNTVETFDLTAFNWVRISWWQQVPNSTGGILFEHSPNTNIHKGGFFASVNLQEPGRSAITVRNINDQPLPRFNTDNLFHGTIGEWEKIAIDLRVADGTPGTNAIQVYKNDIFEPGTDRGVTNTDFAPFRNDTFFIGARSTVVLPFVGNIDELMIEGFVVPEPGTAITMGMAVLGFAIAGRRWRSRH